MLQVETSLLSIQGNGIDDVVSRIELPIDGPLKLAAYSSLLVDAGVSVSPPFETLGVPWSLTMSGHWVSGDPVVLTLDVPANHDSVPHPIHQSDRP